MFSLARVAAPLTQLATGQVAAAMSLAPAAAAAAQQHAAAGAWSQQQQQCSMSHLALTHVNPGVIGGPGGRSSTTGGVATVFGATGFVGHYIVNALARAGTQVVCPYRCIEERAMPLKQMGDLGQIVLLKDWHMSKDEMTRKAIASSNIVINLIGSSLETRNFSFEDIHTDWPKKLAGMVAENAKTERFIHFSDMGASPDHPSRRLRSKAAGDAAVRQAVPSATIFKPGPIMGDEDDFLNNLLFQVKFNTYVWMIDDGVHRSEPTHVTDVASAVYQSLTTDESKGQTYYLGGPEVVSLRQMVDLIHDCLHETEDNTLYVPAAIAKMAYGPGDAIRKKLPPLPGRNYMYSVDYVDEISRDKLTPEGAAGYADLGIQPMKVTEGLPIEAIRYQRTGGYSYGDTKTIAKSLPANVKRYWGMGNH